MTKSLRRFKIYLYGEMTKSLRRFKIYLYGEMTKSLRRFKIYLYGEMTKSLTKNRVKKDGAKSTKFNTPGCTPDSMPLSLSLCAEGSRQT
jgi:hypothetical protein